MRVKPEDGKRTGNYAARLQDNDKTVNTGKYQFDTEETSFAGLTFSKKGIQPDPTKVEDGPTPRRSNNE